MIRNRQGKISIKQSKRLPEQKKQPQEESEDETVLEMQSQIDEIRWQS